MMLSSMMKKTGVPAKAAPKEDSQLKMGMRCEAEEHPWLQPAQIRRLANDHIKTNPTYYTELEAMEKAHEDAESPAKEVKEHASGEEANDTEEEME